MDPIRPISPTEPTITVRPAARPDRVRREQRRDGSEREDARRPRHDTDSDDAELGRPRDWSEDDEEPVGAEPAAVADPPWEGADRRVDADGSGPHIDISA